MLRYNFRDAISRRRRIRFPTVKFSSRADVSERIALRFLAVAFQQIRLIEILHLTALSRRMGLTHFPINASINMA